MGGKSIACIGIGALEKINLEDGYSMTFSEHFSRETTCVASCLLPWVTNPSKRVSTLKEQNLLLEEQILFFKSWPQLRMELIPIKNTDKKWNWHGCFPWMCTFGWKFIFISLGCRPSSLQTIMIETPGDLVWDLPCMQQASYLAGGPLMWMLPLYLHVYKKNLVMMMMMNLSFLRPHFQTTNFSSANFQQNSIQVISNSEFKD